MLALQIYANFSKIQCMHCFFCKNSYFCDMDMFLQIAETVVIYHIKRCWHEMEKVYNKVAAEHGGSLAMGFALLAIKNEGTPVTQIGPRIGMEPNSLSRLLKSMEKKELVYRKKDHEDKRRVYICLTEKGVDMQKLAMEVVFKLNNMISENITQEKLDVFFEVMNKVSDTVAEFKELMTENEAAAV